MTQEFSSTNKTDAVPPQAALEKSKSIVRLQNICKSYDGKSNLIENFNLDIAQGTFLTILGPSGCGKTTVLRMIAGLESVNGGKVFIDNVDVTDIGAEKRQVNTVFQSYALFPHMNIFENVAFGLRMQKIPSDEIKTRVIEALAMVKLDHLADRMPNQLSGGQQQRVAIARAVVNKPKVLLLDESLSALDYQLRLEMQNELKTLQRKLGISFIFVTHDQEEALAMSDRIIVMNKGRIVQDGTPREIYEEPANLFVAEFIGEINVFKATVLERVDAQHVLANVAGRKCEINTELDLKPGHEVSVLLRPEDLVIEEIKESNTSADGIYGHIVDLNYKGMTLDSRIELADGTIVIASEFFNEDDPSKDHKIGQKVAITWFENWEVVLDEKYDTNPLD